MSRQEPAVLSDVLTAAAGVLQNLEGRCTGLQDALSPSVGSPSLTGPGRDIAMQDLDYVTQSLASLSYFLATLADGLPRDWRADAEGATAELPLEDLAAALRLAPTEARAPAGDLELFE